MSTPGFDREIAVAIDAAREAARVVLEVYATTFSVDRKLADEPVTSADRRANAVICSRIAQAFPNDGIVAEESVPSDRDALAHQTSKRRVWFIDPLDGTKEFIARNGEFSVMIGLAIEGRANLGIVCQPTTGAIWVGASSEGTWRIDPDGSKTPCGVSNTTRLSEASLVVSRSHRPRALLGVLDRLPVRTQLLCGSVGLKAQRIASGEADLYVYMHQPFGAKLWDGCAPESLVRGAGGRVTDTCGCDLMYAGTELELQSGFVASNGRLHDEAIAIFAAS